MNNDLQLYLYWHWLNINNEGMAPSFGGWGNEHRDGIHQFVAKLSASYFPDMPDFDWGSSIQRSGCLNKNYEVILETKEKDKGSHQFIHSEGESQIKIAEEKRQKFDGL